jgi:HAD superfamily hydrolase (TIGR01484 family)
MQINAILSDYDGTLCPTASINNQEGADIIPETLDDILWSISEKIPICIISSKDFRFLHPRTKFANILSCILGTETLITRKHTKQITSSGTFVTSVVPIKAAESKECTDFNCLIDGHVLADNVHLRTNSSVLAQLAEEIVADFKNVTIEKKFSVVNKGVLAGITIDWRHMKDWKSFKLESEPYLKQLIKKKQQKIPRGSKLHLQTYTTHPFLDVYAINCNKGMAFDCITSEIFYNRLGRQRIMYLGDSENDNPAFRKADISIGIYSDNRLNPKLNCQYKLNYNQLSVFLKELLNNDFVFCLN